MLHDQISENKKKRDAYIKMVSSYDGEIKQMRGVLDRSMQQVASTSENPAQTMQEETHKLNLSAQNMLANPPLSSTPLKNPASRTFLHGSPRRMHSATSTPFKTRPPQ